MLDHRNRLLDEWLVLRSREGDAAAFARLVERWQERLWRHAFRLTGREASAWDVLQESWVSITKGLLGLREADRFGPWAYAIVTRRAADELRKNPPSGTAPDDVEPEAPPSAAVDEDPRVGALRAAVSDLPPDARTLLWLRFVEGYDLARIATAMDLPEGTVKSRLHHLKKRLRERLERTE